MKVYIVLMNYGNCDGDYGRWQSPVFLHRDDAVAFLEAIKAEPETSDRRWKSTDSYQDDRLGPEGAVIFEMEALESFEGFVPNRNDMLFISFG